MGSKKKHRKKHHFRHAAPASTGLPAGIGKAVRPAEGTTQRTDEPAASRALASAEAADSFSYVGRDVRRVIYLAGGFVVLQLILWYLLQRTDLGSLHTLIRL